MRRPDERVGLSGRGRVFPVEGTAAAESWMWGGHDSAKELEGGQPNCRVMNGGGRWGQITQAPRGFGKEFALVTPAFWSC